MPSFRTPPHLHLGWMALTAFMTLRLFGRRNAFHVVINVSLIREGAIFGFPGPVKIADS